MIVDEKQRHIQYFQALLFYFKTGDVCEHLMFVMTFEGPSSCAKSNVHNIFHMGLPAIVEKIQSAIHASEIETNVLPDVAKSTLFVKSSPAFGFFSAKSLMITNI